MYDPTILGPILGHVVAICLLTFAIGFTLVVYFRSRSDVRKIRDEIHSDLESMTESLLYVIDGLTKIRKESNELIENHEEHEKRINRLLDNLNVILEKTKKQ